MKEFLVKSVKTTFLLLLVVAMCRTEGEYHNNRRSNMGLFPFPRVGRSDSSVGITYDDLQNKRQGLIPFPRVGRSDMRPHSLSSQPSMIFPSWMLADNLVEFQKRNSGNNANGMWFGPRLGRLQKRSFDYNDAPWAFVALKEPSLKQTDFVPRINRESEEDSDGTLVEEILSRRLDSKSKNNISQQ